jgi:hypothetical protein
MTVTEVTTSIAIIGAAAFVGLMNLPRRRGSGANDGARGRFVVVAVPPVVHTRNSPWEGLRRSGRGGARFVALTVVAVVSGTAVGL